MRRWLYHGGLRKQEGRGERTIPSATYGSVRGGHLEKVRQHAETLEAQAKIRSEQEKVAREHIRHKAYAMKQERLARANEL